MDNDDGATEQRDQHSALRDHAAADTSAGTPNRPSHSQHPSRQSSVDESNHPDRPHATPRRQGSAHRRYKRTACFVHSLLDSRARMDRPMASHGTSEPSSRPDSPPGTHTPIDQKRALTKKEVSDMALGVRELSKHLGAARLKLKIHSILVLAKPGDHSLVKLMADLCGWLLLQQKERKSSNGNHSSGSEKTLGYTVYIEKRFEEEEAVKELAAQAHHPGKIKFWTSELCTKSPHLFDLVLTLGGDGTVLHASCLFQRIVPPVLSFALGSLGFLTNFDFKDYPKQVSSVLQEGVTAALRMRIECAVFRAARDANGQLINKEDTLHADLVAMDKHGDAVSTSHKFDLSFNVLNDMVVDRGPNAQLSSLELFGDDEHLTSISADGVVVSTPTGSTAYSLSAGGSLCHPEIPTILISPICPHTLSFRPLLVPDSMVLQVAVAYDSRSTAWASFDGRNRVELKQGDYVRVSASRFPFPTCLRGKQTGDWFESIATKLSWNARKRQKPLDC
ncbi:ATP-NAD kinase-like domain-containing protein [Protomyces lactucae-debilis]|uniref:ATP-NAD kinase-like domain-containing protein n=1 Tax=Protomyces lactucae-debilis TaxID=2754530 RepID=A0A1Y2EQR2_PROLT|nr:ATP-NAD kinase-like domain-containing protein [Protomyces lactucae-debilis]ORY73888.1 ATP-NAD kinase-like domain-containing protein [Protomyces lactucae-debilis]